MTRAQLRRYRLSVAKHETPSALTWTAACVVAMSVLSSMVGDVDRTTDVQHVVVACLLLVSAVVLRHPRVPAAVVPWGAALCSVLIVGSFELEVLRDPTTLGLGYVLIALLAYGPFTMDLWAMAVAAVPLGIGLVVATEQTQPMLAPASPQDWVVAALGAVLIGAVILRVRLRTIDALAAATELAHDRSTRDPLTGQLNRRGIEEQLPELLRTAARRGEPVFATFVDIDGLKAANDTYGHDFGDEVVRVVADAVRAAVRSTDLVGRWGGDEFIVVGVGQPLPADAIGVRVRAQARDTGLDLAKWPGLVSIGSASATGGDLDVALLIRRADMDMYERRRHLRAS